MQFRGIESMAANIQYVGVPLLALVAAGIARLVIHRYLVRWEKRKGVETITRLVGQLESASTPLLLIAALYLITYALPLAPERTASSCWVQSSAADVSVAWNGDGRAQPDAKDARTARKLRTGCR